MPDWQTYECQKSSSAARQSPQPDRVLTEDGEVPPSGSSETHSETSENSETWLSRIDPLRRTDAVGPYAVYLSKGTDPEWYKVAPRGDGKVGMLHMLSRSPRWRARWRERVWDRLGGTVEWEEDLEGRMLWDSEWKPDLWEAVCWYGQGVEGFEMLGGKDGKGSEGEKFEKWRERLARWKGRIEQMEAEPASVSVGRQRTGMWPDLKGDMRILTSGFWPGT